MREVLISDTVFDKVAELRIYLVEQLKLSRKAAHQRTNRIEDFLVSLSNAGDYPLCRFKKGRVLGYKCAVFEKD